MEQEEAIDGLLCETPSLLPTLSLSLASSEGPQAPEGPTVAPAAAAASPAQTTASSHNHGKGIKVRNQRLMMNFFSEFFSVFHCVLLQLFSLLPPVSLVPLQIKEENIIPQIKLEPHEVDQFLNLSPKGQNSHEAMRTPSGRVEERKYFT